MWQDLSNKTRQYFKRIGYSQKTGVFREEPYMQYLLPWAYVDEKTGVIHGKDYSMMAVYQFRGPDLGSSTKEELMQYTAALNNAIKSFKTGFVLYWETQKKISEGYEQAKMPKELLQKMEEERAAYYSGKNHFENEYYFIVFWNPPSFFKEKLAAAFITDAKNKGKNSVDLKIYGDMVHKFSSDLEVLEGLLAIWLPQLTRLTSEKALTYLHSLISNTSCPIKVNRNRYISDYICDCSLQGGREPKLGEEFMKIITILNFPPVTSPGTFDVLNSLGFEYRWVSRFICLSQGDAAREMENYRIRWNQQIKGFWSQIREAVLQEKTSDIVDESALENRLDASAALLELKQNLVSYGYYTMTVIVKDRNQRKCAWMANAVVEAINSQGFLAFIEKDNSMEAWWGSLPGCYQANVRRSLVNSINFCHLAPVMATWPGDKKNEYLQGPVLLYTDTSGFTPFRLNLHVGDVGHTMICGPSGTGKSVLLNTLEAQFLKYPHSRVFIFDKSASSRALTLALGGSFINIGSVEEKKTAFQPLAEISQPGEITWAKSWLLNYLKGKNMIITPQKENALWQGLNSLAASNVKQRTISNLCSLVQDREIRQGLQDLTMAGNFGALFDNDTELTMEEPWEAFEMETLMATPAIVPITLEYLFHRIEKELKKNQGPSLIVLDECWLFFDNPIFHAKLREYFKDMRKKNTSIIFATQNLADMLSKTSLLLTIIENCPTRIFLPNANAGNKETKKLYELFGCNQEEVKIISRMSPKADYYYASPKGHRVFRLALQKTEYPFVTATGKKDQQEMDRILSQYGKQNFAQHWLQYKEKGKNKKSTGKKECI